MKVQTIQLKCTVGGKEFTLVIQTVASSELEAASKLAQALTTLIDLPPINPNHPEIRFGKA